LLVLVPFLLLMLLLPLPTHGSSKSLSAMNTDHFRNILNFGHSHHEIFHNTPFHP
jgi:hypothetical protein